MMERYNSDAAFERALAALWDHWSRLLDGYQVSSGDEKLDRMVNIWNQYQPLTKKGNLAVGSGFNDDPLWLIAGTDAYLRETGRLFPNRNKRLFCSYPFGHLEGGNTVQAASLDASQRHALHDVTGKEEIHDEHHHRRGDGRDDQRPVGVDQLQLYHKLVRRAVGRPPLRGL